MGTMVEFYGFKIKVNAKDHNPPHVHIEGNGCNGRYNILDRCWMDADGFSRNDLKKIEQVIFLNHEILMNQWSEFHEE
jgi:hypothetical protein